MKNSIFQDMKINDGLQIYADPIARMMKRYELKKGAYEYSPWAQTVFDELKWCSNTKDIITPFWRIFASALVFCSKQYEISRGEWKKDNVRPTYIWDDENCMRYRTEYDNRENYFMNEYYCINGNNLIGRPMFVTQSLCNPLPHTEKEVQQCINSVVRIIKSRGRLMNVVCCGENT